VTCCDAISGLTIRKENCRCLENLGHVLHVMHGKSVVKVYYHAMPVNIAASSVCLVGVKPSANNNFRLMISTLCRLFPRLKIPFPTLPGGLLMTILIFTLILSIQDGRFSIEVHLTSPRNRVYLFNPLSQSDFG
jgi:hypothetical protein